MDKSLEQRLVPLLSQKKLICTTAESCTGGLVAERITSVPGVSAVYCGGFVTYNNEMKHKLLGVSERTLEEYTAVSVETAFEMAKGAREKTGADIAVSITGNAGPSASEGKPVGMVFVAVSSLWHNEAVELSTEVLPTDTREEIRIKACNKALELIIKIANLT